VSFWSQRVAGQRDAVIALHDAVENGVGKGGIADPGVPVLNDRIPSLEKPLPHRAAPSHAGDWLDRWMAHIRLTWLSLHPASSAVRLMVWWAPRSAMLRCCLIVSVLRPAYLPQVQAQQDTEQKGH
jgi:hypothetical protein